MSMYALLRNNPVPTHNEMESAFEGMMDRILLFVGNCFLILWRTVGIWEHLESYLKHTSNAGTVLH